MVAMQREEGQERPRSHRFLKDGMGASCFGRANRLQTPRVGLSNQHMAIKSRIARCDLTGHQLLANSAGDILGQRIQDLCTDT
jgi:hypothetical protein